MTSPISTMTEQNYAVTAQLLSLTQAKQSAQIAIQLIEGAMSTPVGNEPQDFSTVTREQLESPIDIRI